jgi:hypothetical protein
MAKENTALAEVGPMEVANPAEYADLFDIKENMQGVDVRLPQIGIIHQAQLFLMPDEEKAEKFEGIILDVTAVNAWWAVSFDESGGGTPPQCFSNGAVQPSGIAEDPQAQWCSKCDQNTFGSSGRGKACKNMKRIHIKMDDALLPYRLTLPPSNLKAINEYVTTLSAKAIPYQAVITEFSLKPTKNKEGITYSLLACKQKQVLPREEVVKIKKLHDEMLPIMKEQAVGAEEYA